MSTDVLGEIFSRLETGGWGDLENLGEQIASANKAQSQKLRAEAEREAAIVKAALDNDAGRALLDLLVRKTLFRPSSGEEQAAATAEAYAILKARREGQNAIVFMLLQMLAVARGQEKQGGEL
ncbi:MAG: hypothetical protein WCZ28_06275 [Burkholderiaceae bacterium]